MEISHVSGAGPYITPYHWIKGLLKSACMKKRSLNGKDTEARTREPITYDGILGA